ncbi:MAG: PDZ domain-containing protein [Anaerolineae bacterium]|nr:PDZ domain-containing protein [Anaerolineae bacterium]
MKTVLFLAVVVGVLLWWVSSTLIQQPPITPDPLARPYVGIFYRETDAGLEITQVMPLSPAAEADLRVGDVILTADGQPVSAESLAQQIQSKAIGETLLFGILREGQPLQIPVIVAAAPNPMRPQPQVPLMPTFDPTTPPSLGVFLRTSPDGQGVIILEVEPDSIASEAGLQVGDVIREVNGMPITHATEARDLIRDATGVILLKIQRGEQIFNIGVTLIPSDQGRQIRIPPPIRTPIPTTIEFDTLGITVAPVPQGLQINSLMSDSPAERAGLNMRDIIIAIDGVTTLTNSTLRAELLDKLGTGTFTITVIRNGETLDLTVEALEFPLPRFVEPPVITGAVIYLEEVGIWEVQPINQTNPFYQAGLRQGDRITLINGESFERAQFGAFMRRVLAGETFTLTAERGDRTLEFSAIGHEVMLELLTIARPTRLIIPRTPRP